MDRPIIRDTLAARRALTEHEFTERQADGLIALLNKDHLSLVTEEDLIESERRVKRTVRWVGGIVVAAVAAIPPLVEWLGF